MAKLPVVPLHAQRVVTSGKMINNARRWFVFKYIPHALLFHREQGKKNHFFTPQELDEDVNFFASFADLWCVCVRAAFTRGDWGCLSRSQMGPSDVLTHSYLPLQRKCRNEFESGTLTFFSRPRRCTSYLYLLSFTTTPPPLQPSATTTTIIWLIPRPKEENCYHAPFSMSAASLCAT